MSKAVYQIGVDLGGTKTEVVLLDPDARQRFRKRLPTPGHEQPDMRYGAVLECVCMLIRQALAQLPGAPPCTVGVGLPGTLDPRNDRVDQANLTCLNGRSFKGDLQKMLRRPVGVENDANCFTLAEARAGAARGYGLVFGMVLGTGCGGGICIDGRIHRGRHQIAGEWGHFSVDPDGQVCFCGNPGCIETKISGTGVAAAYHRRWGRRLSFEQIVAGCRSGDPSCATMYSQFLDAFGRCVGGLISLLDPDVIVIGGGVSNLEELYTLGVENVRRYAYHKDLQTPILKNELGDAAGVFGAAWIGE